MPLPRAVARFNRHGTNRLFGPLAPHLPLFGVVRHTGRKSRLPRRTPVNVFARPGGCAIALTYGPDAEWVRNVLAAGGCVLETRGRAVPLTNPRVVQDPRRGLVPPPVRLILALIGVDDFLVLDRAAAAPS
jgi:deazaflavin-dependent oxidoreductase (nitroreductase family)